MERNIKTKETNYIIKERTTNEFGMVGPLLETLVDRTSQSRICYLSSLNLKTR